MAARASFPGWLKVVLDRAPALPLLFLAGYIGWLLVSDNFWQMLNPRFMWLQGAAMVALLLCGAVLLVRPVPGGVRQLAVWSLFCVLLAVTLWGPSGMAQSAKISDDPFAVRTPEALPPLEIDGRSFERITPVELVQLLEKNREMALAGDWVLRGMVARSAPLDARASFALVRPFIWCCLADAVAAGFVTPWEDYENLQPGQWVQVAGRVQQLGQMPEEDLELSLGPVFVALDDKYALAPAAELGEAAVQVIEEPEVPFVFSVNETPPFNW